MASFFKEYIRFLHRAAVGNNSMDTGTNGGRTHGEAGEKGEGGG